jgi:hypothetical protein
MLTQAASADNSLNNQASQTSDALKVQLADNLKTQLGLLDECHKTIPHQISQVTTLIDYLNQIVAKSQLLVDHETKLIQASASHENRQLNWAKNNIYSTNESLRLLIIVYKSLGGTETLDSSIRATPSPCRSIDAEIESIADQQGAILAQEKSAFVKAKLNFDACKFPDYPRMSLRNEEVGTVRLMFLTDAAGSVERVLNRKSSGSPLLESPRL